ncbi:MAG: DUF1311 domain-containing protein [Methyloceanibacter sp.]|nr:DUF1311 domain-containing protein [Methyloceanibacter sp.]
MGLRLLLFAVMTMLMPLTASAGTDIEAACYKDCESSTTSNPDYKACVARAADKADAALNQAYKDLLGAVRAAGQEMGQASDTQVGGLKDTQKQWIAYRDANCTFEDSLAFGGTAIGGNYSSCLCALSYQRINDFDRIKKDVLGSE